MKLIMKQINTMRNYSNECPSTLNDMANDFDHFLKILTVESNDEQQSVIPEIKITDDYSSTDSFDLLDGPFVKHENNNVLSSQENIHENSHLLVQPPMSIHGYLSAPGSPNSSEFILSDEPRPRSHSAPSSPLSSDGGESYSSRSSLNLEDNIVAQNNAANNPAYKYDPRPLGRKRRRNLVPQDKKTREYWERRQRNNVAARRSREERRNKELETYQKMQILEKENASLRETVENFMRVQYELQNELQYLRQLINIAPQ